MKPIMTTHPRISIEMTIITAIIIPARAPISMPDPCEVASVARVEVVAVGDDVAIVLVGVISAVSVMGVVGSGTGSGASKQTEGWIDEWDWAGRRVYE